MKLTSPAFKNNELIPTKYTCDGQNTNPALLISDIPNNAVSLALIVDDPDTTIGTWTHWTVWNIDPNTIEIKENSIPPSAVQGITSAGTIGYHGPCPPSGTHRYFFKLYALDTKLDPNQIKDKESLLKAMANHILNQTELIGLYGRK